MRTALLALALCFGCCAPLAAQQTTPLDEFYKNEPRMNDLKALGVMLLQLRIPERAEQTVRDISKNYWAFKPDSNLSRDALEFERGLFESELAQIADLMQQRQITELVFVGYDEVLLGQCQDWYLAAYTPQGPILITISIQFDGTARIFGLKSRTDWDEIKQITAKVERKATSKVFRMTYKPGPAAPPPAVPDRQEKKPDAAQNDKPET